MQSTLTTLKQELTMSNLQDSKEQVILSTRQPASLKHLLTRAEFNPDEEFGVVPCQRTNCDLCKDRYLVLETAAISTTGAILFRLNKKFHCNSKYILYLLRTIC